MSRLPASLAPWSEALAALDAHLAVALGPLVHRIDTLVRRLDSHAEADGEPDGYDGTASRGHPERLLAEEWLLADEVPLEFLRRAADGELRYTRLARREPAPTGRIAALVDCGPEQLGAGRLVHLAALVVLHARAVASGSDLEIVDAGSGLRATGPLDVLLPRWLGWRTLDAPDPSVAAGHLAAHDVEDQVWVLGGPTLAAALAPHRRVLSSRVATWGESRAASVEIRVAGHSAVVEVPGTRTAVAALRGEGLLARRTAAALESTPTPGHGAAFTSAAPALLWRGERPEVLVRLAVPDPGVPPRPKRYVLPGQVLAAAVLGKRTVALITDGSRVWPYVVGRDLHAIDGVAASTVELGLDADTVASIVAGPVRALFLQGRALLVDLPDGWWVISAEHCVRRRFAAVAPGRQLDLPETVERGPSRLLLGPDGLRARSDDERHWHLLDRAWLPLGDVTVRAGHRAVALVLVGGEPCLLTRSRAGEGWLLCLAGSGLDRTLTAWSGEDATYSVHPERPWLARTLAAAVEVADLATGELVTRVRLAP